MEKKQHDFISRVDFTEQTPDMLLTPLTVEPLYEKAFLSSETDLCGEYGQNTTCWD